MSYEMLRDGTGPRHVGAPGRLDNLAPLKSGILEKFSVQDRAGAISEATRPNCESFLEVFRVQTLDFTGIIFLIDLNGVLAPLMGWRQRQLSGCPGCPGCPGSPGP